MNLTDIYRGYRRSEPPILWGFKIFMMIMFVACLSGYLAIIIIDVNQDAPIIISSLNESRSFHAPNMVFSSNYKYQLTCIEIYYGVSNTDFVQNDCKSDLTQPDEKYGPGGQLQFYWGLYQPSPNVIFKTIDKSNNYTSLSGIVLGLIIIEEILPNKPLAISMVAIDSEYDPYSKYIKEKRYNELFLPEALDSTSPHDNLIIGMNAYALLLKQYYQFRYTRKIKEFIKPSWMNDFGIPPTYENKPYISSTLLGGTLQLPNQADVNATAISIMPMGYNSYNVEIEREVRSHTYLGGLGLIGGAWGLVVAIYACLFGTDALQPWGFVQSYCCGFNRASKNKLKESLPTIPFYDTSNPDIPSRLEMKNLSLTEQNELILSRMSALELFLQDHVVNVRHLDKIRNENIVSSSSFTPNSNLNSIINMTGITNNNLANHNLNTGSMYSTAPDPVTVISSQQQQQQGLMITTPPNFAQPATNYSDSFADTRNTLQYDNSRQQNTSDFQP